MDTIFVQKMQMLETSQDCGVEVEFDQYSRSSHRDQNLVRGTLGYVGKIQEIIEVDLSSFQCVSF